MLNRFLLLIVGFIISSSITAQNNFFSLNDVIPGGKNYRNFRSEDRANLQWIQGTENYCYSTDQAIITTNAKTGKVTTVLTLDLVNTLLADSLTSFSSFQWLSANEILFNLTSKKVIIDTREKKIQYQFTLPKEAENIDYHTISNKLAYTIGNNLFIATPEMAKVAVTTDNLPHIVNGQSYHRNEFGIEKGTFWSPKGNLLAFARMDESMVGNYPLVNIESREAALENIKYPMAGMKSHEVVIGIYNPSSGSITYIETGEPKEQYLTNISWSPDETTIYIAVINREQNHMKLNSYNASSGKFISTLFEEKNEKYVEPEHALEWLPNINMFVWQSKRDGHNHLYLFNSTGELIKQLTNGNWDITEFQGFDTEGKNLYYTSTAKSPIERHTYQLTIETGKTVCLTTEAGTHTTQISSSGSYLLDNWSNTKTPRKIDLVDISKGTATNLLTAKNPYSDYQLGELQQFTIKAADDSTDLYCAMITPPNYDKSKKYPVIVYVYGGPHDQLVNNEWTGAANMWQQYMAQLGYIAFTVDNRGSANRGNDFEQVIHRKLGQAEMADQLRGIDFLKKQPFVDENRIGVHGWSYGGFMTTSLMTNFPETFKVGVAGGPVIDWKYYEIMYGERYMDTPAENSEGYENTSLLNNVSKLKGRLLIIHGAIDPTVVWQHSLQFVNKCIEEGVQLDYFVYPRHEHNVRGKDRIHLMEKVTRYFQDFL